MENATGNLVGSYNSYPSSNNITNKTIQLVNAKTSSKLITTSKPDSLKLSTNKPETALNNKKHMVKWGAIGIGALGLITAGILLVKGKSTQAEEVADEATMKLRKDITGIYDKIFDDLSGSLKQYNFELPKPKINFVKEEGARASYCTQDNKLNVNLESFENLVTVRDKDGNLMNFKLGSDDTGIINLKTSFLSKNKENHIKLFETLKKDGATVEPLTEDMKKAYIGTTISHEMRHYIQNIMMLNEKDLGPDFIAKMYGRSFFDEAGNLTFKGNTINIKDLEENQLVDIVKNNCPFLKNYKPADIKGAIVINPKTGNPDHIYSALHFQQGLERYFTKGGPSKGMGIAEYYANPMEIDAYFYAADFAKNNLKKLAPECPDDVIKAIETENFYKGTNGHNLTRKFDFTPIINKNNLASSKQ